MKHVITGREARQLNAQGFAAVAGEIVDCETMPEWIGALARSIAESAATASTPAREMVTRRFGDNSPRARQAFIKGEELRALEVV